MSISKQLDDFFAQPLIKEQSFYVFHRTISRAIECSQYRKCIYSFYFLFIFYITIFIKRHFENAPPQKIKQKNKAKTKQKKTLLCMIHMGVQVCIILQFWNISQICFALNEASGPTASWMSVGNSVIANIWSPLRQCVRLITIGEYDATVPVPHVHVTSQINCSDVTMLSQKDRP